MSQAKRFQTRLDAKLQDAIFLCVEVGAIEQCPAHEDEFIDTMMFQDADDLTSTILAGNPHAIDSFGDRGTMVKYVRDALASAGEECGFGGWAVRLAREG